VRLADLHDQAAAVGGAHERMEAMERDHAEYRRVTDARMAELEVRGREDTGARTLARKHERALTRTAYERT